MTATELLLAGWLAGQPTATAPTNSSYDTLNACAGSPVVAFARQPSVKAVDTCVEPGVPLTTPHIRKHSFPAVAHFPLPRYDLGGGPVLGDGLVIYEGMTLSIDPNQGICDVDFVATVPEIAVTLRLQLVVTFIKRDVPVGSCTVTLPPIRLEPPREVRPGDPLGNTFRVNHRGYHPDFGKFKDYTVTATRSGSARFGTPVLSDASYR